MAEIVRESSYLGCERSLFMSQKIIKLSRRMLPLVMVATTWQISGCDLNESNSASEDAKCVMLECQVQNMGEISADGTLHGQEDGDAVHRYTLSMVPGTVYRLYVNNGYVYVGWDEDKFPSYTFGGLFYSRIYEPVEYNFDSLDGATAYIWTRGNYSFALSADGAALDYGPSLSQMSNLATSGIDGKPYNINLSMTRRNDSSDTFDSIKAFLIDTPHEFSSPFYWQSGTSYGSTYSTFRDFSLDVATDFIGVSNGDSRITHPVTYYHAFLLNSIGCCFKVGYIPLPALNQQVYTLVQSDAMNNRFSVTATDFPLATITLSEPQPVSCAPHLVQAPTSDSSTIDVGGTVNVTVVTDIPATIEAHFVGGGEGRTTIDHIAGGTVNIPITLTAASYSGESWVSFSLTTSGEGDQCFTYYSRDYVNGEPAKNYQYDERNFGAEEYRLGDSGLPVLQIRVN